MKVERIITGLFETNTYLLSIDNKAILIDPSGRAEKLINHLGDKQLIAIVLTHGHFDHIKAVDSLVDKYGVDVYLNKADEVLARSKVYNSLMGITATIKCPIKNIEEGILNIPPFSFETIYAPGHTDGSTIFKYDDMLFVGDVLFKGSVGRTDLYSGSDKKMRETLKMFKDMDGNLKVYPGHGDFTTIKEELLNNPFIR